MNKNLLLFLLFVLSTSCSSYKSLTSIIPISDINMIPKNSNKIIINSDFVLIDNYNNCYKTLLNQDYIIEKENRDMGFIVANKNETGDTKVKIVVVCEDFCIKIRGEWSAGTKTALLMSAMSGLNTPSLTWYDAYWTKRGDRPGIAFSSCVKFAKSISNNLIYENSKNLRNKL